MRGIWGVINAVCDGKGVLAVSQEQTVNSFARRAFQLNPLLASGKSCWIGLHLGTKEQCMEIFCLLDNYKPSKIAAARVPDITWVKPYPDLRYDIKTNSNGWCMSSVWSDCVPATF